MDNEEVVAVGRWAVVVYYDCSEPRIAKFFGAYDRARAYEMGIMEADDNAITDVIDLEECNLTHQDGRKWDE